VLNLKERQTLWLLISRNEVQINGVYALGLYLIFSVDFPSALRIAWPLWKTFGVAEAIAIVGPWLPGHHPCGRRCTSHQMLAIMRPLRIFALGTQLHDSAGPRLPPASAFPKRDRR